MPHRRKRGLYRIRRAQMLPMRRRKILPTGERVVRRSPLLLVLSRIEQGHQAEQAHVCVQQGSQKGRSPEEPFEDDPVSLPYLKKRHLLRPDLLTHGRRGNVSGGLCYIHEFILGRDDHWNQIIHSFGLHGP